MYVIKQMFKERAKNLKKKHVKQFWKSKKINVQKPSFFNDFNNTKKKKCEYASDKKKKTLKKQPPPLLVAESKRHNITETSINVTEFNEY